MRLYVHGVCDAVNNFSLTQITSAENESRYSTRF